MLYGEKMMMTAYIMILTQAKIDTPNNILPFFC